MCIQQRLKSVPASVQSDQSSLSAWKNSIHGYPKCAQLRFWPDCPNVQADLNLRRAHISEGTLSDVAAQFEQVHFITWPVA